jgi:hypothetical protein
MATFSIIMTYTILNARNMAIVLLSTVRRFSCLAEDLDVVSIILILILQVGSLKTHRYKAGYQTSRLD